MWLRKCLVACFILIALCGVSSAIPLLWDASDGADGYKIYYGLGSGQYSNSVDVGNVTEWEIPDTWPRDVNYYFAAMAYNESGESGFSNEAIYYAESSPPALATDVRITFQQTTPEPLMAIDLTLEYSVTATVGYRTNTTIGRPTNTADSDFLLAALMVQTDGAVTAPSGWTLITSHVYGTGLGLYIYYKRASSEPESWTWEHAYTVSSGFVKRITGIIASGDPSDATPSWVEGAYGTSAVNAAITTGTNGSVVCQIADLYHWESVIFNSHTLTNRAIANNVISLDADVQATAGSSGTKTVGTNNDTYILGILIALKPAAAGGSIVPLLLNQYRARRQ
jgi:hypothetical protein